MMLFLPITFLGPNNEMLLVAATSVPFLLCRSETALGRGIFVTSNASLALLFASHVGDAMVSPWRAETVHRTQGQAFARRHRSECRES